jgi:hypothetical protein
MAPPVNRMSRRFGSSVRVPDICRPKAICWIRAKMLDRGKTARRVTQRLASAWASTAGRRGYRLPLLVFSLVFMLYALTISPDLATGDIGEFQYLPARLGLPHSNGFPFYMLVGWAWSHVPLGTVAWRMNMLSAFAGAVASAVTTAFARRLSRRASVGLLAGGFLAVSPSVWSWSLTAERYTLVLALLIGGFWMAWENRPLISSLFLGLALATHFLAGLLVLIWLPYILWRSFSLGRVRRLLAAIVLAGMVLLVLYAYVPWRWCAFAECPPLQGVGLSSAIYRGLVPGWYVPTMQWQDTWHYVVGESGSLVMFGLDTVLAGGLQEAVVRTADVLAIWRSEVPWPITLLVLPGVVCLLRRDKALTVTMVFVALCTTVLTGLVQQPKPAAYLLPAFWAALFVSAFALHGALSFPNHRLRRFRRLRHLADDRFAVMVVSLVVLALASLRFPGLERDAGSEVRQWWEATMAQPLEEGAGLVANWSDLTPFWYLQQAEGQRIDLWGLYPPDPQAVIEPWLETGAPLYLAGPLHGFAADLPEKHGLLPWGNLVRIIPEGEQVAWPSLSHSAATPPAWPLTVSAWEVDQPLTGGDAGGNLRLSWEAREPLPAETFLAVRLRRTSEDLPFDIDAPLAVNWYPEDPIPRGTQGLTVIPVRLPLGTPPGEYAARLTVYRSDPEEGWLSWPGVESISLGQWEVAPSRVFVRTDLVDEIVPAIPFSAGPLALRSWRLSEAPVRPGDPVQLEMLWEVRERPTEDVSLSLSLLSNRGEETAAIYTYPLFEGLAPDAWDPGVLLRSTHTLRTSRAPGDRAYQLEARLTLGNKRLQWWPMSRVTLGDVRIKDRIHVYTPPDNITATDTIFGEVAQLAGCSLNPSVIHPGDCLTVTLYWRSEVEVDKSYTVFVHVVDGQGQLTAQHDSPPANGTLPTNLWVSGEIIIDDHTVRLPSDIGVGTYALHVGIYNPATGGRLPVSTDAATSDGALRLTHIEVTP